jgi:hypothetical protein
MVQMKQQLEQESASLAISTQLSRYLHLGRSRRMLHEA